jgi:hypothetical protein
MNRGSFCSHSKTNHWHKSVLLFWFFFFGLLFSNFRLNAQELRRFFLDTAEVQTAYDLEADSWGKFWIGGTRLRIGDDYLSIWLYRLNGEGQVVRRFSFPFSGPQNFSGMIWLRSSSRLALVYSETNSVGVEEQFMAVCDTQAILQVTKLNGLDQAVIEEVQSTKSGKLLLAGFRGGPGAQGNDYLVAKVSLNSANPDWIFQDGLGPNDHAKYAIEAANGDILFNGDVDFNGINPLVGRLDSNGNWIWDQMVATTWNDGSQQLLEGPDGRIWLVGESSTSAGPEFDATLTILGPDGVIQWQQWLGSGGQDAAFLIRKATGQGFWVGGYSNAGTQGLGPVSPFLMRLNDSGISQGEQFWNFTAPSPAYDLHVSGDSLFYFCGSSNGIAYWLRVRNPELTPTFTVDQKQILRQKKTNFWVADGKAWFHELPKEGFQIFDLQGRNVLRKPITLKGYHLTLPPGVYQAIWVNEAGQRIADRFSLP